LIGLLLAACSIPLSFADRATFSAPNQLSVGMQWVFVNGVPVIADGAATSALPGQVLRGQGFRTVSTSH
jgi:dihydroorotase/N-acyl-D-amino-acid deacylase